MRKVKSLHSLVQVGAAAGATKAMEQVVNLVEKVRSFHSHKTLVVKADTRKYRIAKLWTWCAEVVERRGILRKSVSRLNIPHSLEVLQASTSTAGAGASEPLYFDDDGQPVYTYMVFPSCEQTFN